METYKVQTDNESLDSIAYKFYGYSFGVIEELIKANPNIVWQDSFLIQGTVLNIPQIEQTTSERIKLF